MMRCDLLLFLVASGVTLVAARDGSSDIRLAKQIHSKDGQDQNLAETGFGGGGGGGGGVEGSKYFHYQHLPEHDKYEFGYRRGNDHHVRERYEKAHPHEGHFKTKVRWADKKGGHGEHYWDYNHAGHGGDDDGEGGYSDPVPAYTSSEAPDSRTQQKRQSDAGSRRRYFTEEAVQKTQRYVDEVTPRKRTIVKPQRYDEDVTQGKQAAQNTQQYDDEVPFYEEPKLEETQPLETVPRRSSEGFVGSFEDEVGKVESFDIQRRLTQKRQPEARASKKVDPSVYHAKKAGQEIQRSGSGHPQLFFDLESGRVIDENTGRTYLLQPYHP